MKRYPVTRDEDYPTQHESIRHAIQGERRSEELKLDRLKKLLQTKLRARSGRSTSIRAA